MKKSELLINSTAENSSKTVLELIEIQNIYIDAQCRSGFCGSCRVKLLHGLVEYNSKPMAALKQGEILPCACKPVTSIKIDLY